MTYLPPEEVRKEAKRGLELHDKFKRGGTSVGIARARDLSGGKSISPETIKRMYSYFKRHEVDKKGKNWANTSNPSAGYIAWLLWGGDAGFRWCTSIRNKINRINKNKVVSTVHPVRFLPSHHVKVLEAITKKYNPKLTIPNSTSKSFSHFSLFTEPTKENHKKAFEHTLHHYKTHGYITTVADTDFIKNKITNTLEHPITKDKVKVAFINNGIYVASNNPKKKPKFK